jgi:hypothetical protein
MYLPSTPRLEGLVRGLALLDTAPDCSWHAEYVEMTRRNPLPAFERGIMVASQIAGAATLGRRGQNCQSARLGESSIRHSERDEPSDSLAPAATSKSPTWRWLDFPAFCGREKLTALPARRSADAYESEYREDPSDL